MSQVLSEMAKISGITAFLSVILGYILGFQVLIKYIKTKQFLILNFFFCIIFTLSPWYPSGLGYLYWLITGSVLNYEIYVLLGNVAVPIAIIAWLYVYLYTLKPNKIKIYLICYGLISLIFEFYLIYFLFIAPGAPLVEFLGVFDDLTNPIDIDYKGFVLAYLGSSILLACITGVHFSIRSMKNEDSVEIRWKGRFLLVAFILFGFSAIFDAIIEMNPLVLIIIRILLVISNIFFFMGFLLPSWTKRIFKIKEE
jgi:hypothetical protein